MKKIAILIVSLICTAQLGQACGPYTRYYLAADYSMFRACGENMNGEYQPLVNHEETSLQNCQAWARITSRQLPVHEIYQVVYKWSIPQVEQLRQCILNHRSCPSDNQFARWIVKHSDRETVDFLLMAKRSEVARLQQHSAWYYPVEGDDVSTTLAGVVDECNAYHGTRLRDRYALQALRALFASARYSECINYWHSGAQQLLEGPLRTMGIGYVGGSYFRIGQKERAVSFYLQNDDISSAYLCSGSTDDRFGWIYRHAPNHPELTATLQRQIHKLETDYDYTWKNLPLYQPAIARIYARVNQICSEKRISDLSPWYYANAFLLVLQSRLDEAGHYLDLARQSAVSDDLKESIHVLDILVSVLRAPRYDSQFEQQFFTQLKWLDRTISAHFTGKVREAVRDGWIGSYSCGYSLYYWNDMMRKIVIGHLVPLCIRSGYPVRALQYLNMADNHLFHLGNQVRAGFYSHKTDSWQEKVITMQQYRQDHDLFNEFDYKGDYFINLDSLGVEHLQQLAQVQQHPRTELDRFLKARSYTDPQFLCDIIGTQLIAARRYSEAVSYLSRVSLPFNYSRNILEECDRDPFSGKRYATPDISYRLSFAREMADLEQKMAHCQDPNQKAEWMLRYVRGMENSYDSCWPLTSFYQGEFCTYPFYSRYQCRLANEGLHHARQLKEEAFALFTDPERAAKALYQWNRFRTAATRYPATSTARYIRSHCDVLHDYR